MTKKIVVQPPATLTKTNMLYLKQRAYTAVRSDDNSKRKASRQPYGADNEKLKQANRTGDPRIEDEEFWGCAGLPIRIVTRPQQ